jgi:hypothetical protein
MKPTSKLHDTLITLLKQMSWIDYRHMNTFVWMIIGLLQSKKISLSEWVAPIDSRAKQAQSTERRFRRWLNNCRIIPAILYKPLIKRALKKWQEQKIYLALDTSMLWNQICIIRLVIIYRGRAIPLAWKTIAHKSSAVKFSVYKDVLEEAKELLPENSEIFFLADRGFVDTKLMIFLSETLHWHWRIRFKNKINVFNQTKSGEFKLQSLRAFRGEARFYHNCFISKKYFGQVHLAFARPKGVRDEWIIVSDEPTSLETFNEYGLRFDIEENFLDDKSNGFQLESSKLRCPEALNRLFLILAVATLFLVVQGTEVVAKNKRKLVDPHWKRGLSYFKIGWRWIQKAIFKGLRLVQHLFLSSEPDPEPVQPSNSFQRISKTQLIVFDSYLNLL